MALELKGNICQADDCLSFKFFDTTGPYDAVLNPTGYGAPNIDLADVEVAELSILPPNFTTPVVINVFPTLPNINSIPWTVVPADLGLDTFKDGIYEVTYTIKRTSATAFIYSTVVVQLFVCNTKCCIKKMAAKAAEEDNKCCCDTNSMTSKFMEAKNALDIAVYAACCGQKDNAVKLLKKAGDICTGTGCGCGC